MIIKAVIIEPKTLIKIYEKHSVLSGEIKDVLINGNSLFRRVGGDQYVAIGMKSRYLVIFFKYNQKTKVAEITTAYPASRKQIKIYRKLRR